MNDSKLSIKHACAAWAAFLGLLSAAAITAAFLFTRNSTIVWLGLLFILLVFTCAALFVAFLHWKLVLFSDNLCQTIDDMLNGAAAPQVCEEENLFYKINHRLVRLYEVMRENRESAAKERADLQELISDISHQTLTPIANLKLYAELLRELVCNRTVFDVDDSELSEVMDTLCGQTEKLDFLIQSLVKLSRMETGLIGVHVQAGNIQSLFDAVYQEYRKKASEKGITLTFETSRLRAVFDLKWMGEALGNIVDNAVKYTQAGGKVQVSARAYTFFVRIDVADNGIGIAPEDFHRIFTRFYRCLSADDQPGVGIGLYLAREIVQAQRGYMKVASKKGEGSLFSVFLPVP